MSPVEQDLTAFMNAPDFICSFARAVRKHFLADSALDPATAKRAAGDIAAGDSLVLYATGEERNFVTAHMWCVYTLQVLCEQLGANHDSVLSPFVDAGFVTFYTLGMGPQYPQTHPRWAPHLCLVFVNEKHVRAVPLAAREPVRARMVARAGCVYNADNVWQPETLK